MDTGVNRGSNNNADGKLLEPHHLPQFPKVAILLFTVVAVSCFVIYRSSYPFQFLPISIQKPMFLSNSMRPVTLAEVLRNAAMPDKTVIVTALNEAWARPNSVFDLFLESFRIGNQTQRLLNHLVVVALDQKAYHRCLEKHRHCYALKTKGVNFSAGMYFMTGDYLRMLWRRIEFLNSVLALGYNFLFTDTDIMWFRDPFPHFYQDGDFQIACDEYYGNSIDMMVNKPNAGFYYAKSNNRTIRFYKFWYDSRSNFPGMHDQDVFNNIRSHPFFERFGTRIRFLDTTYFGGFCQPSKDFNVVCTMHANCCLGLDSKIHDLLLVLDDWRRYMFLSTNKNASQPVMRWSAPQNCSFSYEEVEKEKAKGEKTKAQKSNSSHVNLEVGV